ncbi:MAG: ERCC4 domain-containing protein [Anaerolineales bacterium]
MISAIMIDQREPDYIKSQFPDSAVTLLETGDAWVACDDGHILLIERKTNDDLLNSLKDGRLLEQISRLVENRINQQLRGERQTYWPYLVITGAFAPDRNGKVYTGRETGWNWNAVQGALLTVQELGCYVVHCPSDTEYASTIKMLANRKRDEVVDILPQKEALPVDAKSVFLMGLPGIGLERARQILERSGGILAHALVGLTDLEIKSPIGEVSRQKIRGFLGLRDNQTIELSLDENDREKLIIFEKEKSHV